MHCADHFLVIVSHQCVLASRQTSWLWCSFPRRVCRFQAASGFSSFAFVRSSALFLPSFLSFPFLFSVISSREGPFYLIDDGVLSGSYALSTAILHIRKLSE